MTIEAATATIDPQRRADPQHRVYSSSGSRARQALDDLDAGLRLWQLWLMFGWIDIQQRYRRAIIGPFWITISMGVMVGTLGVVYSTLFRMEVESFIPFLAAGFCSWYFITTTISDSTLLFTQAEALIKNGGLPLSIHLYRLMWRNTIIFAHNVAIMALVYLYFGINPGIELLLVIPGLALVILVLTAFGLVIGMICLRFRDAAPIVTTFMQMIFFATPILYNPAQLGGKLKFIAQGNPFYHLVEAIRAPLLGRVIPLATIEMLALTLAIGSAVGFLLFRRFRSRIAYWL